MSFPPLHPTSSSQSSASSDPKAQSSGSVRPRQSVWAQLAPPSSSRRGLAPLSTGAEPFTEDGAPPSASSSGPSGTYAPSPSLLGPSFSSFLNSSSRFASSSTGGRSASSATAQPTSSTSSSIHTGSQQLSSAQLLSSSSRSQTTTPSSASHLASSAAVAAAQQATTFSSQEGGGGSSAGGGGQSRSTTFSPSLSNPGIISPASSISERNPFSDRGSTSSASNNQSSVGKIVVTQVFLLLSSITEKEGKAKWDSQAETVRKLVYSNGMEVFAKYFRRLLVGNSPQIFPGINRNVENPANYQLLVEEVEKAAQDPQRAHEVADIIETGEGDIFRDFDLGTFLNHFKLDAVHQTIFASAFSQSNKPDLRSKAAALLTSNHHELLKIFHGFDPSEQNIPATELAAAAYFFLRDLPVTARDGSERDTISYAFIDRYSRQNQLVPLSIRSAIVLVGVMERNSELAHDISKQGPSVTTSLDNAREFLRKYNRNQLDAEQIANALLFMVMFPDGEQYQPETFVQSLRDLGLPNMRWEDVLSSFDREGLVVDSSQLLRLYKALEPIALEDSSFDIQLLWGGQWRHRATQLSFAVAFSSLMPHQLNAKDIPNLRVAYDPREWDDVPESCAHLVADSVQDPLISLDAVTAIIDGLWDSKDSTQQDINHAKQVIGAKIVFFLSSAGCMPKPWVESQQSLMAKTLVSCLRRSQTDYQYILHCLWKQDKTWLASRLVEAHTEEPLELENLLQHALEHHWLDDLLTMVNAFGIDLAALAHRKGLIDLKQWADDKLERGPREFANSLARFLLIKAEDEMRTYRKEQSSGRTVSLAMKTIYVMLGIVDEHCKSSAEELASLKRRCMQAFPRLCNYGEGFDDIIEANGAEGNTLLPSADAEMSELYKRMYSEDRDVRSIVEMLRDCKNSKEHSRQELFACMIHGLFDEFVCFNEYPPGPLSTTAVLFGGIISYGIVSGFALDVALQMVLESVKDYGTESLMFRFGVQALMHFKGRLREWKDFAKVLVQIPGLQGTPVYPTVQEALSDDGPVFNADGDDSEVARHANGGTNGHIDDSISHEALVPQFQTINPDLPQNLEHYQDPNEGVQDKVLFVLNNVTEQNISTKIDDIIDSLEPKHHQWFAAYLVEQRAKSQPNYQPLYLELLRLVADKGLWADVLRETYVSIRRVLNAEATMKNAADRAHLKNLGTWLGLLTLARDKPVKHKNIAFKELLIEGWETQRLLLVIPFTCEVLAQGAKSIVFKPPNPWLMDVIALLLELYDLPDLKIQQKFAVEVLLGTFGLPRNGDSMDRSTELKKRQLRYEAEMTDPMMPDGMEGFEDVGLGHLNRGLRNTRLSPTAIASTLPDLSTLLVYPPALGSSANNAKFRQVVQAAVRNAVLEIIGPVVERSVTIATIATKDLVAKDYAQESDEGRLRSAFETMAKATSGSLAAVTSKEPLRISITNNIRNAAAEIPGESIAEGIVLMCVNDNLEIACKIIEKQAEERALPEIRPVIEAEVQKRQHHKANMPNEPYRDPITSQWSSYIAEPYKQVPGGLNQQQLDIYEHFAPQVRGAIAHAQTASTDSGKQIPDVLQDASFPNMPNLSTPAEPAVLSHQQQSQLPPSNMPMSVAGVRSPLQLNGFVDANTIQEHVVGAVHELARITHENPDQRYKDLTRDSPVVDILTRIIHLVRTAQDSDNQALEATLNLHKALYPPEGVSRFGAEIFSHAIKEMCTLSTPTMTKYSLSIHRNSEEYLMAPQQVASLLDVGLVEYGMVDSLFVKHLANYDVNALRQFADLLDLVLFVEDPVALRADFASSLAAIGEWVAKSPEIEDGQRILSNLRNSGVPEIADLPTDHEVRAKQAQMHYVFQEWMPIFSQPQRAESLPAVFISQFQESGALSSQENFTLFLRQAFDIAAESFDRAARTAPDIEFNDVHHDVDALARLLVLMTKTRGIVPKAPQGRAAYMKSLLSFVVLILNSHHVIRGEQFSQRTFFRFFSSLFYDWQEVGRDTETTEDRNTILAFAEVLLILDPNIMPGFTYGWLQLISHRVFLPAVLKDAGDEGPEIFASIMEVMLLHVSKISRPSARSIVGRELYDGALRVLLILHHDFPEFLAENHYRFCNVIPADCIQLRNLVLSAYPSSIFELPDPFTMGLKVDRLDDIHKPPSVAGDLTKPLIEADIKDLLDTMLATTTTQDGLKTLSEALSNAQSDCRPGLGSVLGNSVVLYIGASAAISSGAQSKFTSDAPPMTLLSKLVQEVPTDVRFHLFNAMANQLRYPNSHTHFFSNALLHLFAAATGAAAAVAEDADPRQQITRVLLERLIVHRPHPWGLIITLLEILKNPAYAFWELAFIKAAPEVTGVISRLVDLAKLSGDDKGGAALPMR